MKSDSSTLEELRINVLRFSVIELRNVSAGNALIIFFILLKDNVTCLHEPRNHNRSSSQEAEVPMTKVAPATKVVALSKL